MEWIEEYLNNSAPNWGWWLCSCVTLGWWSGGLTHKGDRAAIANAFLSYLNAIEHAGDNYQVMLDNIRSLDLNLNELIANKNSTNAAGSVFKRGYKTGFWGRSRLVDQLNSTRDNLLKSQSAIQILNGNKNAGLEADNDRLKNENESLKKQVANLENELRGRQDNFETRVK